MYNKIIFGLCGLLTEDRQRNKLRNSNVPCAVSSVYSQFKKKNDKLRI